MLILPCWSFDFIASSWMQTRAWLHPGGVVTLPCNFGPNRSMAMEKDRAA
jgi:hypothetical protein